MAVYQTSTAHAGFLGSVMDGRCASSITAARCDTASIEEAAAVFGPAARKQGVPPVTGVVLSGGVLADAVLASQTAGEIGPILQALCYRSWPNASACTLYMLAAQKT